MNKKKTIITYIEAGLLSILFAGITLTNLLLFNYLFDSLFMLTSFLVTGIEIFLIVKYLYPIIFKDYLNEYYSKKEEVNDHHQTSVWKWTSWQR